MTKQEQINEMAKTIALDGCGDCNNCKEKGEYGCYFNAYKDNAESLYDAGYRKVLLETEDGYAVDCPQYAPWELIKGYTEREVEKARKETAREILSYVGNLDDDGMPMKCYLWFVNLCKKYGVEIEE